jgi:hypothetical protein
MDHSGINGPPVLREPVAKAGGALARVAPDGRFCTLNLAAEAEKWRGDRFCSYQVLWRAGQYWDLADDELETRRSLVLIRRVLRSRDKRK